ncbi:MAG: hypothetical protein CMH54_07555 [Myxococcales bacterium]|nr:hypothetical protein [Myxococcales bacterium]
MPNRFPEKKFSAFVMPDGAVGQPLNAVNSDLNPVSETIEVLIQEGRLFYNGSRSVEATQTIRTGDWGWWYSDDMAAAVEPSSKVMIPEIVAETDEYIVIDKPSGMACQEAKKNSIPHVLAWWQAWSGEPPLHPVHRLDVPASGLVVFAKNPLVAYELGTQFQERTVGRAYRARLSDILSIEVDEEELIDAPLIHRQGKVWVDQAGKKARTRVRVLRRGASFDEVLVHLETGRFHQIRMHMSHIDAPIVGDVRYGGPRAERLYLHAAQLAFTTSSGERVQFESLPSWDL